MGALTFGSGSVSFTMDDDFSALVDRALEETLPGARDRLQAAVDRVYAGAQRWPVRSGFSRSQLVKGVEVSPDLTRIRGHVGDEADYALYVVTKDGSSAYRELLAEPMRREGAALIEDLRELLERTLGD